MDRPRRIDAWTAAVAVLHGLIVLAATSHRVFFGSVGRANMFDDVGIYFRYASKAMAGSVPYRDFLVEYPLGAFPLFLLPRLFASTFEGYKAAFGLEMLLANAAALFLAAREVGRSEGAGRVPVRLAWYTAFFGSLCPLLICRFDLAAMALTFAAASAWFSGRPGLGGVLTGLGTLVKVVPGVIAAPALVWEFGGRGGRRGRGTASFAATLTGGVLLWLVLGGSGVRSSLGYHLERGLEVGSLYAGVVILAAKATAAPLAVAYRHSSLEVLTPWSTSVAAVGFPLQAASLSLVMWKFARSGRSEPLRYAAAAVLGFVTFGKVLSPQYLIWLFPFMTVLRGTTGWRARALFLLACVLTTLVYPGLFGRLLQFQAGPVGLLNARNAVLLWLWLLLVFGRQDHDGPIPPAHPVVRPFRP